MLLLSRRTVHSSMDPYGLNMMRTSFSLIFFDNIPTKSFLSVKFSPISQMEKTPKLLKMVFTVAILAVGRFHLNRMVHLIVNI